MQLTAIQPTVASRDTRPRSRILVVGNRADVPSLVAKAMRRAQFEVHAVAGVDGAVKHLLRETPDLILADSQKPNAGLFRLISRIRDTRAGRDVPLIVLSSSNRVATKICCLRSGATDYLVKPIDSSELAARLEVHVRQHRELMRLQQEATTDELTGTLTRRAVLSVLQREVERAARYESSLTVLLIDVDKFKSVNDTFGHLTGDRVLKSVANAVAKELRQSDFVGRLGGDEFVIVLPELATDDAANVSRRLRRAVKNLQIDGISQPLSISIGSSALLDSTRTPEELLDLADRDMYRNKRISHMCLRAM